ncbi:MAG: hypothetical protein AAFN30_14905 [Actinomycetota bacterium]
MTDWSELLDRFEARLARCRRLLDDSIADGAPEIGTGFELGPWPPPGAPTGPLPPELASRARRCLDEADALAARLEDHRRQLPPVRSQVRNRRASGFSSVSTHL